MENERDIVDHYLKMQQISLLPKHIKLIYKDPSYMCF
jgi:hypothetical protein